ncbi:MAG: hypothetical protein Q8O72_04080 [Bacteroidales bacterium]|nr:hypothetical protein [Bacteroidales bacterium]
MKFRKLFLLTILIAAFSSCRQGSMETVTKKIQYDVNIKTPDPNYDWWIQNLVGPDREKLVDMIMYGALEGGVQAYDYFNNPITPNDIKMILADTILVKFRHEEPPYELYDSLIVHTINRNDIQRIRFMEEWKINRETLQMQKTIYGISPVARRLDSQGVERWQPLFWLYTDKEFIKKLKD